MVIPFDCGQRFIIFSDQHKDGSDVFADAEKHCLAALEYYHEQNYCCISLGNSDKLWANRLSPVIKVNSRSICGRKTLTAKAGFHQNL